MKKAVPYYRVSSERQGISGLGLEAQEQAVRSFALSQGFQLLKSFTEIETGAKNNRPVIRAAIAYCRRNEAVLLIAKLDRLARNVAFISNLMESGIDFVAVDNPFASKILVHIMAAFAEHERDMISIRTKEALRAAKKRGVLLGVYGRKVLSLRNIERANEFATELLPIVSEIRQSGITTIRGIRDALNNKGIKTFRGQGYRWHANTVMNLLKRMEQINNLNQS